jgi:hypothetical protein
MDLAEWRRSSTAPGPRRSRGGSRCHRYQLTPSVPCLPTGCSVPSACSPAQRDGALEAGETTGAESGLHEDLSNNARSLIRWSVVDANANATGHPVNWTWAWMLSAAFLATCAAGLLLWHLSRGPAGGGLVLGAYGHERIATSATLAASASSAASKAQVGVPSNSDSDPYYIRWLEHPHLCFGIDKAKDGMVVQASRCTGMVGQRFFVPASGQGKIHWAQDPGFCLDAPGIDKNIVLRRCEDGNSMRTIFELRRSSSGTIRLTSNPHLCVALPGGPQERDLGTVRAGLEPCDREGDPGPKFIFNVAREMILGLDSAPVQAARTLPRPFVPEAPASAPVAPAAPVPVPAPTPTPTLAKQPSQELSQLAFVTWAAHPTKCLHVLNGVAHNGNAVHLRDCDDDEDLMFLLPQDGHTGQIRWAPNPEFCLNSFASGALLGKCDEVANQEHLQYSMPAKGSGRIHLAASPDHCFSIPEDNANSITGEWAAGGPCEPKEVAWVVVYPVDCEYGDWGDFSLCSAATCGAPGVRVRARPLTRGAWRWSRSESAFKPKDCERGTREHQPCPGPPCPEEDPSAPGGNAAAIQRDPVVVAQALPGHPETTSAATTTTRALPASSSLAPAAPEMSVANARQAFANAPSVPGLLHGAASPSARVDTATYDRVPRLQRSLLLPPAQEALRPPKEEVAAGSGHPLNEGPASAPLQGYRTHPRAFIIAFCVGVLAFVMPFLCWLHPTVSTCFRPRRRLGPQLCARPTVMTGQRPEMSSVGSPRNSQAPFTPRQNCLPGDKLTRVAVTSHAAQ